jgi:hypothetical protein
MDLRDLLAAVVGEGRVVDVVLGTNLGQTIGAAGHGGSHDVALLWAADALAVPSGRRRTTGEREVVLLQDRSHSTELHRYAHVVGESQVVVATFVRSEYLDAVRLVVAGLVKRLEEEGAAWPS